MIDLSGSWILENRKINIPGILQAQGFGEDINENTPWVSSLHDPLFYEREEYDCRGENGELLVSFLSQPPKHFIGKAKYNRKFEVISEENYYLYIELTKQKTCVYIDGEKKGEDFSLCTPHYIDLGILKAGEHEIRVEVDNSMQYEYRPDAHSVSDALGASWNGMAGEVLLLTDRDCKVRSLKKLEYANAHPIEIKVEKNKFYVNGKMTYFRGTHFGGDFPLTGYPTTDINWWRRLMHTVKDWGLNFIRFHSFCPPDAAFTAADEEGIFLQVECGMWNTFYEGAPILEVLKNETRRILEFFGHHPSFVLFSPTNEPDGNWYKVLRDWVKYARDVDKYLGYENRRVYTAESGWFYDVEPSKIEGTDYVYFHRSAYGPYRGGMIRNQWGWNGKDYSPSLVESSKPVISHELGQWCAYPDFDVINKFTGYLKPGNFEIFKRSCIKNGLINVAKEMTYASGRNQLRLFKEDLEATFRTKEIEGFELLELHDYLGQGTALVGLLDAFWEEKGYAKKEEFREFCSDTVLLARFSSYTISDTEPQSVEIDIRHYGEENLEDCVLTWSVDGEEIGRIVKPKEKQVASFDLSFLNRNKTVCFEACLYLEDKLVSKNHWDLNYYVEEPEERLREDVIYTREWEEAYNALKLGKKVLFVPYLTDLGYECPSVGIKNVFWNSQMGPTWERNLGILVNDKHPLFNSFPTDKSGGWQWKNIFKRARAFHMKGLESISPIVRAIDDWNRNLPLGLIWEVSAAEGKLLFVGADLKGDFGERPEAFALKNSIIRYLNSEDFKPKDKVTLEELDKNIRKEIFHMLDAAEYVEDIVLLDENNEEEKLENIIDVNPNNSGKILNAAMPNDIVISLKEECKVNGLIYLPEQRSRLRNSFPKDYEIYASTDMERDEWSLEAKGQFKNSSLSQKILFESDIKTIAFRIKILSTYGDSKNCCLAGLYPVFSERKLQGEDICIYSGETRSTTKEIDA